MEKDKKVNYWKVATIILMVVSISLFYNLIINGRSTVEVTKLDGSSIFFPKDFFNKAMEINSDSKIFQICSIKENDCVTFNRLG